MLLLLLLLNDAGDNHPHCDVSGKVCLSNLALIFQEIKHCAEAEQAQEELFTAYLTQSR